MTPRKKRRPRIDTTETNQNAWSSSSSSHLICSSHAPQPCLGRAAPISSDSFGQIWLTALEQEFRPDRWLRFQALSLEECQSYCTHYDKLVQTVPFAIRRTQSFQEVKTVSPLLLLSIILSASGSCPDLERQCEDIFRRVLAERVIIKGQRSLELLQSLLTYLLWHHHRHDAETQQYFQFLQLALGMAADLGLYTRFRQPGAIQVQSAEDFNVVRTFLLCYYLSCGTGILGYDRPDTMQSIQELKNAANLLAHGSNHVLDRQAPALLALMYVLAQQRDHLNLSGRTESQSGSFSTALESWEASHISSESPPIVRCTYHFIYAYGLLKGSAPSSLTAPMYQTCLDHLVIVLSTILEQDVSHLVLLGIAEWGHLLTTLFLLPRLENSLAAATSSHNKSVHKDAPLTFHYIGRFRDAVQEVKVKAQGDVVLRTHTFFGWLDKILLAVEMQTISRVSSFSTKAESQERGDKSAYELVNSFLFNDKDADVSGGQLLAKERGYNEGTISTNTEDFWVDFMSDWLNW
ncbi:hypothetical protein LTR99_009437 [Exophiala xenobiotica]|uniref:Transcription factor domain-containing protein n=1 Tax=Vermiconidia calcicola TaxID=1690605 RepID=A0AAV9PWF3_9PEZI|nr:hypothetical protein LTR92_002265 [Exophiala xenobiotica]KAK5530887.1 hypothetical protein LTR25_008744 [Vermiconidia calcicola]KAK5544379.1 hypothetical protein LTR23_004467 [Chaetothyriales sp. CCFEE 6169]KAK5269004.1 hypothetical protein LTR96_005788 [Exophiala xenobiotica]KAK5294631.1 hypothetical protein LTR99_009437 [Exophiala xenobiotica]